MDNKNNQCLQVAGIEHESIVDGTGVRYVIFTQGCKHNCEGCHNPDTHSLTGGKELTIDNILDDLQDNQLIDGITFSGGDPFFQPDALLFMVKKVREKLPHLNIWAYTGFTYEQLIKLEINREILKHLDVLVDGRFELENRSLNAKFIGSTNQRIIDIPKTILEGQVIELDTRR